jgi:hypothetical protein
MAVWNRLADLLSQADTVAGLLSTLGVLAFAYSILRDARQRRLWRRFKRNVRDWVVLCHRSTNDLHPEYLDDRALQAMCEELLTTVGFTPMEIRDMIDVAGIVVRRIADETIAIS